MAEVRLLSRDEVKKFFTNNGADKCFFRRTFSLLVNPDESEMIDISQVEIEVIQHPEGDYHAFASSRAGALRWMHYAEKLYFVPTSECGVEVTDEHGNVACGMDYLTIVGWTEKFGYVPCNVLQFYGLTQDDVKSRSIALYDND